MKYFSLFIICFFTTILISCEEDGKAQQAEMLREQRYNDSIVKIINNNWKFNVPAPTAAVQQQLAGWNEWHQFKNELAQKPAGTIEAYRLKSKNLADKADQLKNNIPSSFDKPQVKSRIGVLTTKVKSLYTYLNLNVAQDKKVLTLIGEISRETISIQNQFEEIIKKSRIQKELGEEEMLRALDTVRRANPDAQPQPGQAAPQSAPDLKERRLRKLEQINTAN